ncbi:MAG TPA: ATP-binding cassette domain-containing protein [Pseudomonadales bacterium]|nr:ATP-binding cassette domain-containing protein [Pseudomonadales bacterium]
MSATPSIKVEGLNHHFGRGALRKQILFDIEAEIPEGQIIITTGPSGSGKTTLLTLVGALRSTQEGSVKVLGQELNGASGRVLESVRRRVGFIFQQHNLLAAISSLENVELGLRVSRRYKGAALRKRAMDMLDAVGLAERMHHLPEQLSGGQRQRVAIARALAAEPAMVLADEPTASLDKASGREVVDRMQTLAREQGTTILMVTHDNRILDVADRIIHLEDGRLSTFTDSVMANNAHMMGLLAEAHQKQDLRATIDDLDEAGFRGMAQSLSEEAARFLEANALASDGVFRSLLERSLFAFTRKLATLMDAERASLFLVDRASATLQLRVTDELPVHEDIRVPLDSGIVGAVVASGAPVFVDDAYEDPRFNPEIDRRFGYRTRAILGLPILDRSGEVFAVAQLLNRKDGGCFDATDAARVGGLLGDMGVMLEGLSTLAPTVGAHTRLAN